jgi:hypothetical protein
MLLRTLDEAVNSSNYVPASAITQNRP